MYIHVYVLPLLITVLFFSQPVGVGDQRQYPGYPLHQPPDATQYPQPTLGGYPTQQPLDTTQFIGYPPSNTGQYYPPTGGYPPQQVEYSQTPSDYKLDGYPNILF